jgi:hypothetical protein
VEVSEVRRRLLAAIDKARQAAAERRLRIDAAARDYDAFLGQRAAPVFHQLATVLNAQGHGFKVFTPASSVRLANERSPEEFVELVLDDTSDPPVGRGRRLITSERPIGGGAPIADLTEEDVFTFLLDEIVLLIER